MDSATSRTAARILRILPRERISRALGHLTEARVPPALLNPVLALYTRAYNVDLAEAQMPPAGFASFNEFFTRRLRDGLRPIDPDPAALVSPADGLLDDAGPIDAARTFLVKGQSYDATELLGSATDAAAYAGGQYAVVYLSPRDYHRVHAPVAGTLSHVRSMPGDYYPVNDIGVRHVENLFVRNRRVAIFLDTPEESGLGRVAVVMVAAMVVGRITVTGIEERDVPIGVHAFDPPRAIARGDEIGIFRLGSTAVLFFERRAGLRWAAKEGPIRFGEALAARAGKGNGGANGGRG